MSVHTADSSFSFRLPADSYVDAQREEAHWNRQAEIANRPHGIGAWLARTISGMVATFRNSEAESELAAMSDRELADIGLTRSDLYRVFDNDHNIDLRHRGAF